MILVEPNFESENNILLANQITIKILLLILHSCINNLLLKILGELNKSCYNTISYIKLLCIHDGHIS